MSIVSEHHVCIVPFWLQKNNTFHQIKKENPFCQKKKRKSKNQFNFRPEYILIG